MTEQTIPTLLVDAANGAGDNVALVTSAGSITYGSLYHQAMGLAAALVRAGVERGDRVAIWLPKCEELLISAYAALAAGGCYVPIDFSTPTGRARHIIGDAKAKVVICLERFADQILDHDPQLVGHEGGAGRIGLRRGVVMGVLNHHGPATLAEESIAAWGQLVSNPAAAPVRVEPNDTAYILYTSGSTGLPKGVEHTHGSALAFVQWATRQLHVQQDDVLAQHASPSFDLSVFDFFGAASAGATLVMVPEWMFGQVAKTIQFISRHHISVWYSVPSALLRDEASTSLTSLQRSALRQVVFAGEVISKGPLREFARHLPSGCSISNWYGPTETNVCTYHDIRADDLGCDEPVPIGLPCPYASVRIDQLPPVPGRACEGELYVASTSLMKGYWRLDEQSVQVFVQDPDGERFYKTGDIVRYDGQRLYILGRTDRLLKVRGYRVQPEEVEGVLEEHPGVTEAAVVAIRSEGTDTLVGAVESARSDDQLIADLFRRCEGALPPYMVPSLLIGVRSLPRSARGKVDIRGVAGLFSAAHGASLEHSAASVRPPS